MKEKVSMELIKEISEVIQSCDWSCTEEIECYVGIFLLAAYRFPMQLRQGSYMSSATLERLECAPIGVIWSDLNSHLDAPSSCSLNLLTD